MLIRDVEVVRHRLEVREVGGVSGLARVTARHAVAAVQLGVTTFYATAAAVIVGEGDGFLLAARREWDQWRDRLRTTLGHGTMRRGLRASGTDRTAELAWRGVLVIHGKPIAWHAWTPGESHRRHPQGPAPTLAELERIAGPVEFEADPASRLPTFTPGEGEEVVPLYRRGDDPEQDDPIGTFLVDADQADEFDRFVWELGRDGYPRARGEGWLRAHVVAWGGPALRGLMLDHINRVKTDCRRSNLRVVDAAANARNRGVRSDSRSGVKGVTHLADGRWRFRYVEAGKRVDRYFRSREDAATASRERFGGLTP